MEINGKIFLFTFDGKLPTNIRFGINSPLTVIIDFRSQFYFFYLLLLLYKYNKQTRIKTTNFNVI